MINKPGKFTSQENDYTLTGKEGITFAFLLYFHKPVKQTQALLESNLPGITSRMATDICPGELSVSPTL